MPVTVSAEELKSVDNLQLEPSIALGLQKWLKAGWPTLREQVDFEDISLVAIMLARLSIYTDKVVKQVNESRAEAQTQPASSSASST